MSISFVWKPNDRIGRDRFIRWRTSAAKQHCPHGDCVRSIASFSETSIVRPQQDARRVSRAGPTTFRRKPVTSKFKLTTPRRKFLAASVALGGLQVSSPFIIKARGETPVKIGLVDPLSHLIDVF